MLKNLRFSHVQVLLPSSVIATFRFDLSELLVENDSNYASQSASTFVPASFAGDDRFANHVLCFMA
jgi:hypothetical protein